MPVRHAFSSLLEYPERRSALLPMFTHLLRHFLTTKLSDHHYCCYCVMFGRCWRVPDVILRTNHALIQRSNQSWKLRKYGVFCSRANDDKCGMREFKCLPEKAIDRCCCTDGLYPNTQMSRHNQPRPCTLCDCSMRWVVTLLLGMLDITLLGNCIVCNRKMRWKLHCHA